VVEKSLEYSNINLQQFVEFRVWPVFFLKKEDLDGFDQNTLYLCISSWFALKLNSNDLYGDSSGAWHIGFFNFHQ
jgi:hypothetical protein